jgi:UDP-N-acetyl-D-mannosaminuronic acid transferase (WecB/TagA/CpsF family)
MSLYPLLLSRITHTNKDIIRIKDLTDEMVLKQVTSFNPDYIFVGMGYPRQEQWIENQSLYQDISQ